MPANRRGAAAPAATTFRSASSSRGPIRCRIPTRSTVCSRGSAERCASAIRSPTSWAIAISHPDARPIPAPRSTGRGSMRSSRAALVRRTPARPRALDAERRVADPRHRDVRVRRARVSGYNGLFMRFLADYFPLLLFFVAFKWQGTWVATAVALAASVIQIAWFHWRGSVSAVHWLSLAIIVVFGGATLVLRDETFIKWKP